MRVTTLLPAALLAAALTFTACGDDEDQAPVQRAAPPPQQTTTPAPGAEELEAKFKRRVERALQEAGFGGLEVANEGVNFVIRTPFPATRANKAKYKRACGAIEDRFEFLRTAVFVGPDNIIHAAIGDKEPQPCKYLGFR